MRPARAIAAGALATVAWLVHELAAAHADYAQLRRDEYGRAPAAVDADVPFAPATEQAIAEAVALTRPQLRPVPTRNEADELAHRRFIRTIARGPQ